MKRERKKEAVLKQLQKMPVVEVACQRAGISRATYYRWRKENQGFRKAADEAIIEGELLINDMSEAQIISLIREKNWSAISFWLRHHHPKYANKLEINANINPVEQMTPEQEALFKAANKLASLPEVSELDDNNHESGENSNQTS